MKFLKKTKYIIFFVVCLAVLSVIWPEKGIEAMLWTFVLGACLALVVLVWRVGPLRLLGQVFRQILYTLRLGQWSALSDEQRADSHGPGRHACADYPNIEELASESVNFSRCYAAATPCVPSRMAVLSGHNEWRAGVGNNHRFFNGFFFDRFNLSHFFCGNGRFRRRNLFLNRGFRSHRFRYPFQFRGTAAPQQQYEEYQRHNGDLYFFIWHH